MEPINILAQHSLNFQFLSVCHYITSFGIFFYNQELIPLDQQNHSVAVLNTFFEYLIESANESETKLQLLQKVLQGTDLYGGRENETLDMKYVNETYQYIISKALFSHFGYIDGYLAGIINRADNINYSALKEKVFQDLSENYTTRDYCSSGSNSIKLTSMAVKKIFHDHIWPMFPEPDQDMSIIDVNYIYAMVGSKIVRSISVNVDNFTFDSYIRIAREINFSLNSEILDKINDLFSTPALFYRAHTMKEKFRQENLIAFSNEFWSETYNEFFWYLKYAMHEILDKGVENSLHYKFEKQLENLKSRTLIALEILVNYCQFYPLDPVLSIYVEFYKTLYHWMTKLILPGKCDDDLPKLEDAYEEQFGEVKSTYNEIERGSIQQILINSDLIRIMNSPNVVVQLARPTDYPQRCNWCSRTSQKPDENVYLMFAITKDGETEFYALKQANASLILLSRTANESNFHQELGINRVLSVETAQFYRTLKREYEDANVFIQRVADMKTEKFSKELYNHYREPSVVEEVMNIVKSFVPFYSCVESISKGNAAEATWSCSLDIISLIPLGQFSAKYFVLLERGLTADLGEAMVSNTIGRLNLARSIPGAIGVISRSVITTVVNEMFSSTFLRGLTLATLRTIDPGFEITFQISKFNLRLLRQIFQKFRVNFRNSNLRETVEAVLGFLQRNANAVADHTGLVPRVLVPQSGHDIVQYFYPGGRHFFGPRCLTASGMRVELRSLEDVPMEIPVVPVAPGDSPGHLAVYQNYIPETGKLGDNLFRIGKDDQLRKLENLVDLSLINEGPNKNVMEEFLVYNDVVNDGKPGNSAPLGTDDYVYIYPDIPAGISKSHFVKPTTSRNVITADDPYVPYEPAYSGPKRNPVSRPKPIDVPKNLLKPVLKNDYIAKIGVEDYREYVNLLTKFKTEGLSVMRQNKQMERNLRLAIDNIGLIQDREFPSKLPMDLWFIQTVSRRKIVDHLRKLKGNEFYFNDLTLVTKNVVGAVDKINSRPFSLDTIVHYHLKIDSHYGLVDLNGFHENFFKEYIVYPDVSFTVTDVIYPKTKDILILELKKNPLTEKQWMDIRHREIKSLLSVESKLSKRLESIEAAANFLATNVPLFKYTDSKKLLENYILKIGTSQTPVPTYDKMAQDIYRNLYIPDVYLNYRINSHMYIDELLFAERLNRVLDFSTAEDRIYEIFQGLHPETISPIFHDYFDSPRIWDMLRFEDFYVLKSYLKNSLQKSDGMRRALVSSYRLSLRQCGLKWIEQPITLYHLRMHSMEKFLKHKSYQKRNILTFSNLKQFSSKREFEINHLLNDPHSSSERPILYQIEVKNRAGIANIDDIIDNDNGMHIVTPSIQFIIDSVAEEIIVGQRVLVVKMHDQAIFTEERMVKMVEKLNQLYSTGIKFYAKG